MSIQCTEKNSNFNWDQIRGRGKKQSREPRNTKPSASIDAWFNRTSNHTPGFVIFAAPLATRQADVEADFRELACRWKEETKLISSSTDIVMHSDYQDLIGMGEKVVPFILRDLMQNGGSWFWALRHITRSNPVSESDRGKVKLMREAWLAWGREHHFI